MANRWWVYQRERFPLVSHVPFAVLLATAALGWSTVTGGRPVPSLVTIAAASATTLLFLLQLRVADEFKDLEDDRRFRPERPVPRGLVTLRELGWIAVAAAVIQLALALYVAPLLAVTLGLLWAYWGLMSAEFFLHRWLKAHAVAYLVSHIIVVAFLMIHVTAFDWVPAAGRPGREFVAFLAFAFFVGIVVELGRKTWAPDQEREGVETYSRLWGVRGSAAAFGVAAIAAAAAADWALRSAAPTGVGLGIIAACALAGASVAVLFTIRPSRPSAKAIQVVSALTAFALYIVVGILSRYGGSFA